MGFWIRLFRRRRSCDVAMNTYNESFSVSRQNGLTLVEIMVALVVSLVLVGGMIQVFNSSKLSYNTQEALSRLQEDARLAVNFLEKDIRSANMLGCAKDTIYRSNLNGKTDYPWNFQIGIQGYESLGSGSWAPTLDAGAGINNPLADNNDIITIRVARGTGVRTTANMANGTSVLSTAFTGMLRAEDVVMITDCTATTIFQITQISGSAPNFTIQHGVVAASDDSPGNEEADLGREFAAGSTVFPLETVTYFLRNGDNGPVLWRRIGTGPNASQQLVEGVESMEILYGVDTTGSDGRADRYLSANSVTDWNEVVSIRIGLLMRTLNEISPETDTNVYNVNGVAVDPVDDRRLRRVITTTIALRNRVS